MRKAGKNAAGRSTGRGFTLIELLVVIALIVLLLSLTLIGIRSIRQSGAMTRELSAARQLMLAYNSYAHDNKGVLMPGYYAMGAGERLPAFNEAGNPISGAGIAAATYPWRLAPYLDYDLDGLYMDPIVKEQLRSQQKQLYSEYWVSIAPSLGINAMFVGGDYQVNGLAGDLYRYLLGEEDLFVRRLSQVRHPARLITFGSARYIEPGMPGGREMLEGFFRIDPPYQFERKWASKFDPHSDDDDDFGHVSLRYGRKAVVAQLDGSAAVLDESEVQDMRRWCDKATRPDWTLPPLNP